MKKGSFIFFLLLAISACHRQTSNESAAVQKPEASAESGTAVRVSEQASETSMIGFIKNTDVIDGCGCSYYFPTDAQNYEERLVFLENENHTAWINIDGQDVELGLENSSGPEGESKKGDKSIWNYRAGDIRVRIDLTITNICDPDDESNEGCEGTNYEATIKVINGSRRQVVNVIGVCGC